MHAEACPLPVLLLSPLYHASKFPCLVAIGLCARSAFMRICVPCLSSLAKTAHVFGWRRTDCVCKCRTEGRRNSIPNHRGHSQVLWILGMLANLFDQLNESRPLIHDPTLFWAILSVFGQTLFNCCMLGRTLIRVCLPNHTHRNGENNCCWDLSKCCAMRRQVRISVPMVAWKSAVENGGGCPCYSDFLGGSRPVLLTVWREKTERRTWEKTFDLVTINSRSSGEWLIFSEASKLAAMLIGHPIKMAVQYFGGCPKLDIWEVLVMKCGIPSGHCSLLFSFSPFIMNHCFGVDFEISPLSACGSVDTLASMPHDLFFACSSNQLDNWLLPFSPISQWFVFVLTGVHAWIYCENITCM